MINGRDIIGLFGARYTKKSYKYSTPNVTLHYLNSNDINTYKTQCYPDPETKCCCISCNTVYKINNFTIGNPCKLPVLLNGELLSDCMESISIEQVEQEITKILNK